MSVEQTLIDAFKHPIIIQSFNPRGDRMRYLNAMKTVRNRTLRNTFEINKPALSVLTRQKANRIIIGPKEFDLDFPYTFDLETCSQEELDKVFKETYSLPLINPEDYAQKNNEGIQTQPIESSSDILKKLGF